MLQASVSGHISIAFEWASWFDIGLSWVVSGIVLGVVGCLAAGGFIWAGSALSESAAQAFEKVEVVVRDQRGTCVPALATLVAGVGAALSGVFLSKWVGCGVAVGGALATFAFETLAQNSAAKVDLARWIFAFGSVLPFGVIVAISVLSGGFGDVDPERTLLAIGGTAIGVLGVTSGLVAFWEARSGLGTS
jgi:hypothetical protein